MMNSDPPRELAGDRRFRLAGIFGAGLIRLWGATLSIDWIGEENVRAIEREGMHVLYAFWHGRILPLTYSHRNRKVVVLVSRHKDGEIISQIICRLGFGVVRGSSTRGGIRALLEMTRAGRAGHPLAVTPDGPRGPYREVQGGVLHIAQRSGLPIVPLGVEAVRRTELSGWDRFLIPHPWSRIAVAVGPLIRIPPDAEAADLEPTWGKILRDELEAAEARAAAWRSERTGR